MLRQRQGQLITAEPPAVQPVLDDQLVNQPLQLGQVTLDLLLARLKLPSSGLHLSVSDIDLWHDGLYLVTWQSGRSESGNHTTLPLAPARIVYFVQGQPRVHSSVTLNAPEQSAQVFLQDLYGIRLLGQCYVAGDLRALFLLVDGRVHDHRLLPSFSAARRCVRCPVPPAGALLNGG